MNNIIKKIKWFIMKMASYIPTPLPIGMKEFDKWAGEVLALTDLPDNDSTRFALASTVPHQKAESFWVPKAKFASLLSKSAANQIAGAVMHELKEKQQAAIKAEAEAKAAAEANNQAEVSAQPAEVPAQPAGTCHEKRKTGFAHL